MTDPVTMSFSLNEKAINAAIAAELPRLLKDLEFNYTSGRAPKGLTADVTLNEAMIRQAVTSYARRTVNASFTHLGIQFQATRGEEGMTANVTASTAPIEAEVEPEPVKASAPVEAPVADAEQAEAESIADVAQDTSTAVTFEADADLTEKADALAKAAAVENAAETMEQVKPVRSKLFADLKRPDNSATA